MYTVHAYERMWWYKIRVKIDSQTEPNSVYRIQICQTKIWSISSLYSRIASRSKETFSRLLRSKHCPLGIITGPLSKRRVAEIQHFLYITDHNPKYPLMTSPFNFLHLEIVFCVHFLLPSRIVDLVSRHLEISHEHCIEHWVDQTPPPNHYLWVCLYSMSHVHSIKPHSAVCTMLMSCTTGVQLITI